MPENSDQTQVVNKTRSFVVDRQWGQIFGTNIRTYDEQNNLVCFAKQQAFKLKEEVKFYEDEAQNKPLFSVKARNIIDISATYDAFDNSGKLIGSMRRKGLSSTFVRDEWIIIDSKEQEIGQISEDNMILGIARRFIDLVALFIPQTYNIIFSGQSAGTLKQVRNPFKVKYEVELNSNIYENNKILMLAIPNLLAIIEARQN